MTCVAFLIFFSLVFVAGSGLAISSDQNSTSPSRSGDTPPFHTQPPTGPLPATLDPNDLKADRAAYVSYFLAARIKPLLYQVPCHCPCKRMEGHESLLDCFVGGHGVKCVICQKELLLCYRENQKGKSPVEVRLAIERGQAWNLNLKREIEKFYRRISRGKF